MDSIAANSPLGRLAAHLEKLGDPRRLRRPVHLFSDILIIGLCSFFTGGRTFVDMADCAATLEPWLRTFLKLPGGLPSHDTFNRVFAALDSRGMEDVLRLWTSELTIPRESGDQPPPALRHPALDGKVLRGSRTGSGAGAAPRARAVVNLWLADHGLVLAQRKIPEDCGEIIQAPLLLRRIALKNTVVTADAAHAQTGTAAEIIGLGGDYPLCVKGNQAATRDAILTLLEPAIAALPDGHFHSVHKEHGRLEERRAWVCADLTDFGPRGLWKGLGAVAVRESRFENLITGKTSVERRCFLTSLTPARAGASSKAGAAARDKAMAELVARLARGHWKVENSLHWRLDVLMGEDACRTRGGGAPINPAVMRRITLNVLKAHPPFPGKRGADMSIRSRQYVASISPNYLRSLIEAAPLSS
ncbi:MAG: ISAs1 family transposase [Verrucomicrobiota bacterium]